MCPVASLWAHFPLVPPTLPIFFNFMHFLEQMAKTIGWRTPFGQIISLTLLFDELVPIVDPPILMSGSSESDSRSSPVF